MSNLEIIESTSRRSSTIMNHEFKDVQNSFAGKSESTTFRTGEQAMERGDLDRDDGDGG
jgi:hypothetical protein